MNEAFAKRYFPNGDALGHMVRVPELKNHPPGVIAVAGSNDGLRSSALLAMPATMDSTIPLSRKSTFPIPST